MIAKKVFMCFFLDYFFKKSDNKTKVNTFLYFNINNDVFDFSNFVFFVIVSIKI